MIPHRSLLLGLALSLCLPCVAQAQSAAGSQCFFVGQFRSWRAPDTKTIYIRILNDRFYRLDLARACQAVKYPGSHLITHTRGPDTVCSAVDWDLRVSEGRRGFSEPCIVKTMTLLSPKEVADIPKGFKP
jgi:hypothetical protein